MNTTIRSRFNRNNSRFEAISYNGGAAEIYSLDNEGWEPGAPRFLRYADAGRAMALDCLDRDAILAIERERAYRTALAAR